MNLLTVQRSGYVPAKNEHWQNVVCSFLADGEDAIAEQIPEAKANLKKLLEKNFLEKAGPKAKRDDWALVILEGYWMHVTTVRVKSGESFYFEPGFRNCELCERLSKRIAHHDLDVVYVDATYCFVLRSKLNEGESNASFGGNSPVVVDLGQPRPGQ